MKTIALITALIISVFTFGFDYPKRVATVADYENLLKMTEHRARTLKELQYIYGLDDDGAIRVVSGSEGTKDLVKTEIANPNPCWRQKGFKNREEVLVLIQKYQK
uniref:Uncharacterized protein n=1 Tax=viral metagenome TaxID=1070528 RepID=A0A6M3KRE0_9ZZZZ